jgi:signal transduction histidine kinase
MEVLNAIAADFSMLAELNPSLGVEDAVDLAEVAAEVVDLWSSGHPGIQWKATIEQGPWFVKGKKTHLIRVLNNLVSNAVHALEEQEQKDSVIEVLILPASEDQIQLTLSDSGPGIPAAEQDKIFEPRFTTKSHGTGMGLAMVWAIVKQYGGEIAVGTSNFGGACFTLRFPRIRS